MKTFTIQHSTTYNYDYSPLWVIHKVALTPQNNKRQNVIEWNLIVKGGNIELTSNDHFGNIINLVKSKNKSISITAYGTVNIKDDSGITGHEKSLIPIDCYLNHTVFTKPGKNIFKLIQTIEKNIDTPLVLFHKISHLIKNSVIYKKNKTNTNTSAEDACEIGYGVCQDHTHILISVARELGYPARYVSGYMNLNNSEKIEASHAWAEIFFNDLGWVGYDVSNGISPNENYIFLSRGFDYNDVAPIKGVKIGISKEKLSTGITIKENQ